MSSLVPWLICYMLEQNLIHLKVKIIYMEVALEKIYDRTHMYLNVNLPVMNIIQNTEGLALAAIM